MQITIDLLSLFIGLILGCGIAGLILTTIYFDDKWDTAFGAGWKYGKEFGERKQKNE